MELESFQANNRISLTDEGSIPETLRSVLDKPKQTNQRNAIPYKHKQAQPQTGRARRKIQASTLKQDLQQHKSAKV